MNVAASDRSAQHTGGLDPQPASRPAPVPTAATDPAPQLAALAEALDLGSQAAGLGKRALAFTIDLIFGALIATPALIGAALILTNPNGAWPWPVVLTIGGAVLLAIYQLVHVLTHGLRGVTAGKAILRLRSVSTVSQRPPGFWRIMLRSFVLSVSCIIPIVGPLMFFLSSYWDPLTQQRSWLDRAGRCWVIDTRAGLNPLDEPRLLAARRERDLGGVVTTEHLVALGSSAPAENLRQVLQPRSHAGVVGFAGALAGWEAAPVSDSAVERPVERASEHAAAGAPARPRIIFDDGSMLEVPAFGVIGRDPQATQMPAGAVPIRLNDASRRLSQAHLEIGVDERGCWVRDVGSANGSELRPNAAMSEGAVLLVPGERHPLAGGAVVHIGGRAFQLIDESEGSQA